jgi:uncharacterized protein YqgC (DUF456 family)
MMLERYPGSSPAPRTNELRATAALIVGILSLVLIYPLGILLGPLALWLGVSAIRRINRGGGSRGGLGSAVAGVATSGVTCGLYTVALLLEVASLLLTGQLIPAY